MSSFVHVRLATIIQTPPSQPRFVFQLLGRNPTPTIEKMHALAGCPAPAETLVPRYYACI
jgi:hypothetical protein